MGATDRRARQFSVEVPAGQLIVWDVGKGVPALLLHGGPMSDYTEPLARVLPGSLRTVRYQQRGLAPSTTAGPFGIQTHVEDAIRVLDARGISRALVVGHSWGGHLAFHLAVEHPERVDGVVAIDPLGAVPDGGWGDLDRNLFERMRAHSPADAARAEEIDRRATAGAASDDELRESLRLLWPFYFATPEAAPPMPVLDLSVELYAGVVASVFEHFERGTLVSRLPDYAGPFLLIHGERDPLPVAASRATTALVPQARLETLPDCGHFPWLEQPEQIESIVTRFLADTRRV